VQQREALEDFLKDFPLCYGYWKKLADADTKVGGYELGRVVLERGVAAIPNSIELWSYFCTFVAFHDEDLDIITAQFERAVDMVGSDYHAEKLWDKYIEYESAQEEWANVTKLYHRILALPIKALETFWEKFTKHANAHPPGPDEAASAEEYMKKWEQVCSAAKEERSKTQRFETICKRNFFHANPLEEAQQAAWRSYLAFAETEWREDTARILRIYERCLVPCCVYPEFWIRYSNFAEYQLQDVDRARSIFSRASGVHLKRNPALVLAHALFEQRHSGVAAAEALYQSILLLFPALVEGIIKYCNFLRRQGDLVAACAAYETGIAAQEQGSDGLSYLVAHYARFTSVVMGEHVKAQTLFASAQEKIGNNKLFWQSYLELEARVGGNVQTVFEKATGEGSNLNAESKLELWHWYVEYLGDFGSLESEICAEKALLAAYPTEEAKKKGTKRAAENFLEAAGDNKQPRRDTAAAWEGYHAQQQQWAAWGQQQPAPAYPAYPGYPPQPVY